MRFGLSTYLYHDWTLAPRHLDEVAAHDFLLVELFATRTHFNYHDAAAVRDLRDWLTASGLFLHSVHAPIVDGFVNGQWGAALSTATSDTQRRAQALREAEAALGLAQTMPYEFLVVHLGVPDALAPPRGDNDRGAARRSVEELHALATRHGVRLALEVMPNRLSTAEALIDLIDNDLELPDVGLCLDYGHAFLMGDVADTIELAAGHLVTSHIHDNDGKSDSHLVPFDGRIDWSTAVMTTQKVGYEGVWIMELANSGTPGSVLRRAQDACHRLEDLVLSQD